MKKPAACLGRKRVSVMGKLPTTSPRGNLTVAHQAAVMAVLPAVAVVTAGRALVGFVHTK